MSARDCLSIDADYWFETAVTSPLCMETHLPETVKNIQDVKEDCSNKTQPLGCKGNSIALNGNNNNINNNMNMNMLNESEDNLKMDFMIYCISTTCVITINCSSNSMKVF